MESNPEIYLNDNEKKLAVKFLKSVKIIKKHKNIFAKYKDHNFANKFIDYINCQFDKNEVLDGITDHIQNILDNSNGINDKKIKLIHDSIFTFVCRELLIVKKIFEEITEDTEAYNNCKNDINNAINDFEKFSEVLRNNYREYYDNPWTKWIL